MTMALQNSQNGFYLKRLDLRHRASLMPEYFRSRITDGW